MTGFGEPPWQRAKVERALHDFRNEEQQAVERMREEARNFVAHESNASGLAARQQNDLLGSANGANARNARPEQKLQKYAHHMAMVQQKSWNRSLLSKSRTSP